MTGTHWSLGVLVTLPIMAFLTLAVLILLIWFIMIQKQDGDFVFPIVVAAICLAALVIGNLIGFYPYQARYHQWRLVEGTVQKVSSRLITTGDKTMAQRYVVVIDGQPYGVDDTRASLLHKGDHIKLSCKPEFQLFSVPGEACRWNQ